MRRALPDLVSGHSTLISSQLAPGLLESGGSSDTGRPGLVDSARSKILGQMSALVDRSRARPQMPAIPPRWRFVRPGRSLPRHFLRPPTVYPTGADYRFGEYRRRCPECGRPRRSCSCPWE